ncbi:MAG: L-threonylcarbamoyladenylate synthase [Polyangiaceae bacterium]|nr:L-threonylcarbamoyladenylate synthase [Polyangiaceae bacterium]
MKVVPRVVALDRRNPDEAAIAQARNVLLRGGLVAFPTETVYGLGARGLHEGDVRKIFQAKGRPATHPLILHAASEAMASRVASHWTELASRLAQSFWPGPLTLVVPRGADVPLAVTGGLDTVAVRVPNHPVALALIHAADEPLAAPSANAHMHVSPTVAEHVVRSLGDAVDLVLDGGPCEFGIESTVLSLADHPPRVLRPGALALESLAAVIPEVVFESLTVAPNAARASPGLAHKHYSPRARVTLADGPRGVAHDARRGCAASRSVCAIVWSDEARESIAAMDTKLIVLPADAEAYARALFGALYEVDASGYDEVIVERVPDRPAWWAVADRLRRAAASA